MTNTRQSRRRARAPRGKYVANQVAMEEIEARERREERRQQALAQTRAEQERLERRMRREQIEPAVGPALGAGYQPVVSEPVDNDPEPVEKTLPADAPRLKRRFPELPWDGNGGGHGAIGQARTMLREGYHIRKVVLFYGVGLKWFDDIPLDEMGHGLSQQP